MCNPGQRQNNLTLFAQLTSSLKRVWHIVNFNTLVVLVVSLIATHICMLFELYAELPLTIISITVIFPMVFSINSAYQRRERALESLGQLKAYLNAILLGIKDWRPERASSRSLDDQALLIAKHLLQDLSDYLGGRTSKISPKHVIKLSSFINNEGRESGIVPPEISRLNHFVALVMDASNGLCLIKEYRTPLTLKAFSTLFVFALPVLYAPHFARLAESYTFGLVYILPLLFSLVLVSLSNIQDELEDPFDNVGEDDIRVDISSILEGF